MDNTPITRRRFVKLGSMAGGAALLVACGAGSGEESAAGGGEGSAAESAPVRAVATTPEDQVMVGDVERYALATNDWEGDYGWVRFKMHEARHDGEAVYYIRTDTSDQDFANQEKLVYVPLLGAADGLGMANRLYLFDDDRLPVMQYIPTQEEYSSLFQLVRVSGDGDYGSAADIESAASSGSVTLTEESIYVNYPLIIWPGGGLPVDTELKEPLGGGPLTEEPNTTQMNVTFKLHKCYPGSRYIVTDTSAVPMAPMMGIIGSGPTQALREAGGTDEIWVFGNGLPGPGVMGFQPAIFDNKAGNAAWSPFWDHYTVTWNDESNARLLTSSTEIRELIQSGELTEFAGVPDTDPNGFVVNCPAPILSPNDYQPPA